MVQTNFLGGGLSNHINCHSHYGVIAGGHSNCIGLTGGTPAGAFHNFIGGGCNNQICDNNSFSAILGGYNNTVCHNYAGVFGCGVATVLSCAIHANTFYAQNMCDRTLGGGYPPTGTLYFCCNGVGCCNVYIA